MYLDNIYQNRSIIADVYLHNSSWNRDYTPSKLCYSCYELLIQGLYCDILVGFHVNWLLAKAFELTVSFNI